MKTLALKLLPLGVIVLFGFGLYLRYNSKPAQPETPAPAVRQKDGALELERAPSGLSATAQPGSTPLKPAQEIPKGATVERVVQVTVQPTATPSSPGNPKLDLGTLKMPSLDPLGSPHQGSICPPVRVDLSLIRLKDKSQRVLASSPDGTVVGGIDVPITPDTLPKIQRWTAEGIRGWDMQQGKGAWGGELSYERGRFVGTAGVVGTTIFVGAGVRF